jgi:hypothetical protein
MSRRLPRVDPHATLLSPLCARCPIGPTGCCSTPPAMAWSDAGRVVLRGGAAFLRARLADGSLYPTPRGLAFARVEGAPGEVRRCVFHGPAGCTIAEDRRAATCNHYLCEDALGDDAKARRTLDATVAAYARWDEALGAAVLARWPEGPPWDEAFLTWLGAELTKLW